MARSEYAQLRRTAEQRARRLEAKGFKAYHAPKMKDLTPAEIARETARLKRWLSSESSTITGARAALERRREYQRQYRRRKAEESGKPIIERKPLSDEQKRARNREYQKRYRERKKAKAEELKDLDIQGRLAELASTNSKAATALQNLLSGLNKWGVNVTSFKDLKAWGAYIKERNADADRNFYAFDKWIDDLMNSSGDTPSSTDKTPLKFKAEDIYGFINDFYKWRDNQSALEESLTRPRSSDEYSGEQFEGLWDLYIKDH